MACASQAIKCKIECISLQTQLIFFEGYHYWSTDWNQEPVDTSISSKFSAMTILFHATTKPFLHALLAAEVDGKLKDKCPDVRCKVECIKLM